MSNRAGSQGAPGVYDGQEALEVDARDVMDLEDVLMFIAEVQLCETRRVALEEMAMHVVKRAIVQLKIAE